MILGPKHGINRVRASDYLTRLIMSIHSPSCVLSNPEQFYVKVCSCGVVHLSFGFAMINTTPEALIAITETLKDVTYELKKKIKAQSPQLTQEQIIDNVIQGPFLKPAPSQ